MELNQSKLGTRSYWDNVYTTELTNFNACGEKGEVWFGDHSVQKMINWATLKIPKTAKTIDIGMGNGHIVFELINNGFLNCLGVDYSHNAVELAKSIQCQNQDIAILNLFEQLDILNIEKVKILNKFKFAMDKGTFDAISLYQIDPLKPSPADQYVESIYELLEIDGILLITSCNWTADELIARFKKFEIYDQIKYPTFSFGGVKGQTITTLAFIKK
jgi:SAM-dependent methyltransferase